jgi:hypothetical protein
LPNEPHARSVRLSRIFASARISENCLPPDLHYRFARTISTEQ